MKQQVKILINRINHSAGFIAVQVFEFILICSKTLKYNSLYNNKRCAVMVIKDINITDAIKSAYITTKSGHTSFN